MLNFYKVGAAMALVTALGIGSAYGADQDTPVKAKPKPVVDVPFFFVNDNRLTYSYQFQATDPGAYTVQPNGAINGKTGKSVYSFTHFDVWAYGTNFFTIDLLKSGHNDPASPCTGNNAFGPQVGNCAGATEIYGLMRSTFGFNQIFGTKAFSIGPLHNVSLELGADANTANTFFAPETRKFMAGLQFAFDLPYKGYFNIAPMLYKETNHNSFTQCGSVFAGTIAGLSCHNDGKVDYRTTWVVETNYYMDLGFLPPNLQYFSISGRAAWIGPKGDANGLPNNPAGASPTKVEFNSEPIRLTFDAGRALLGNKNAHAVDVWVAYRYWQNKFGLDHNAAPGVCTLNGQSTRSCTENTVSSGITVKF